jgi:hypothetical protein
MRKPTTFLLTLFFSFAKAQDGFIPQPNIYAVIVGIADYKDSKIPDLKYAEKDAKSYFDFLQTPQGGKVPDENIALLTGTKATRGNILKALNEKFLRASSQDLIIFYFSGHGISGDLGGNGYLMSWDTEFENEAGTALEMDDIQKRVEKSKAKVKLNFIDACHAGLFQTTNTKGDLSETNRQISQALLNAIANADGGTISFLASSAREQSLEDDKLGGGVFTHYLIKGLKGAADLSQPGTKGHKNGVVSIGEINTYISEAVKKQTNFKQNPSLAGTDFDREFPLAILTTNSTLTELMAKNVGTTSSKGGEKNTAKTAVGPILIPTTSTNENENDTRNYDPQAKAYGAAITTLATKACRDANLYWYGNYCFINRTGKPLVIYSINGYYNYNTPIVLAVDEKICSYKLWVSGRNNDNPDKPAQDELDCKLP